MAKPPMQYAGWIACFFWGGIAVAASESTGGFSRALQFYEAGRYAEARIGFTRLAVERPNDRELDFYLGRLALWFDDANDAFAHLERAAASAPQDARIQNALGDAYGLMAEKAGLLAKFGWARRCLAAYQRAVQLAPDNAAYRWSLVGYYCMAPSFAGGGHDKALAQAAAIRKIDPMGGRIAFATLYLADKKTDAAFAEFETVLRDTPDDFLALYHIGRCAALSGEQLDRGAMALRRCLRLTPPEGDGMPTPASVHFRLGNILEKQGDRAGAEVEYAMALHEQPDFRPAKIALRN
jgi:tetratricopeptide (TPR) repeat protein